MIEIAGAPNDLVRPHAGVAETPRADSTPLQRSCVAVLKADWSTLALVATDPAAPARAVATALVEMARACHLRPVRWLNGSGIPAAQIGALVDELAVARGGETRSVITVDDPRASPACIPLVVAADAAVLLVRLGASELRSVEDAVELVGRERVLGCIIVR